MENSIPLNTKTIKICHIANSDMAVKFLLLPQLKFLIKEGYNVNVVCSSGKWINDIKKEGIKIKEITIKRKITPLYDLVSLYKLWSYFRKEKFDIVHTHTPKPGLLGQLAAKMAGVPIIINTIHGLYFHKNNSYIKRKLFIFVEKISASCSTMIFSQNREDIETLIKEKIAKSQKIKYLGNGIDLEKFNSEQFSADFILKKKRELGVPEDYKIVGIVARLVKEKGYLELFEATKAVLKVFPKTILLVIGADEPAKKDAIKREIISDYQIDKNVIFLGERNDVFEIYPLMDIFVLPSYREGMPRSILEAMAGKRPIIATDIRGCREEIDNAKNGILVPVKNSHELANAIISLLSNPIEAKRLGNSAKVKAEKYFDEKLVFGIIKKEYLDIINQKPYRSEKIIYSTVKRIIDFILALLLLVLLSPVFLLIIILVKLDSSGPVFYRGERVGQYGKIFKMLKFRTMVPNAEKTGSIHASKNDPRVTKIGRFLRSYKLDEMPQLINILRGEMSFVGPRPQVKHYVDLYSNAERVCLNAIPGMTDYASIYFINQDDIAVENDVDKFYREEIEPIKNKLRIKYAEDRSLYIDAKIFLQTFYVIFKKIIFRK